MSPLDDMDMIVVVEAVLLIDKDDDDLDKVRSVIIIGIFFSSSFLSISLLISLSISQWRGDILFPGVEMMLSYFLFFLNLQK